MSRTLEEIAAEALELPEDSRARLVEQLLVSFEEVFDVDGEIAQAWAEEAERRDAEIDSEQEPGIPADEVFRRVRSSLG